METLIATPISYSYSNPFVVTLLVALVEQQLRDWDCTTEDIELALSLEKSRWMHPGQRRSGNSN